MKKIVEIFTLLGLSIAMLLGCQDQNTAKPGKTKQEEAKEGEKKPRETKRTRPKPPPPERTPEPPKGTRKPLTPQMKKRIEDLVRRLKAGDERDPLGQIVKS
ncbi:MAG: hypothetical protein ACYTHM_04920, partial [Planctomycetota bacterium]